MKNELHEILDYFKASDKIKQNYEAVLKNSNIEQIKEMLRKMYKNKIELPSATDFKNKLDRHYENNVFKHKGYIIHRGKTVKENSFTHKKLKHKLSQ